MISVRTGILRKLEKSNFKFLILLALFLLTSFSGCDFVSADQFGLSSSINNKIERYRQAIDVSYGPSALNTCDIYYPDKGPSHDDMAILPGPAEAVILLHGGIWVGGDKGWLQPSVDSLIAAKKNLVIVNMNYRLAVDSDDDELLFEKQLADIESCVGFLHDNASKYHLATRKFTIMGVSAGGHLAMAYSYRDQGKNIGTVVGVSTITEVSVKELTDSTLWDGIETMVGSKYGEDEEKFIAASPVHLANTLSPRTVMLYGVDDNAIAIRQGTLLQDKLNGLRVPNVLFRFLDQDHHVAPDIVSNGILASMGAVEYSKKYPVLSPTSPGEVN